DGENDIIELETFGKYALRGGKYYIMYEESELTGFEDTTTTIKVAPGNVTVTRRGRFNMKMKYELGEKNLCVYPTPYGDIATAVDTKKVDFTLGESGGDIKIDYILDQDNLNFIKNSLNVNVELKS
ncbi:MAG: DUF1934 domain-containing protein, partial [Oscillospiraceae bacterium]